MRPRMYSLMLAVLVCSVAHQGRLEGQSLDALMDYPLTAKCVGMAGAVSSLAGDYSAVAFNPATLGFVTTPEVHSTLAYRPRVFYLDEVLLSAGAIYPVSRRTVVGAQLGYSVESETQAGKHRAYFVVGRVSYSMRLGSKLSLGTSFEIAHDAVALRYIPDPFYARGTGWSIDASVLYKMPIPTARLALSFLNLGPGVTYSRIHNYSSRRAAIRLGASVSPLLLKIHELTLSSDVSSFLRHFGDVDPVLNLGAEYNLFDLLYLRGGYFRETSYCDGFALGGGLRMKNWMSIDIAGRTRDYEYDPGSESDYYLSVTLIPSAI